MNNIVRKPKTNVLIRQSPKILTRLPTRKQKARTTEKETIGALGIPRDSTKGRIGTLRIPRDSKTTSIVALGIPKSEQEGPYRDP